MPKETLRRLVVRYQLGDRLLAGGQKQSDGSWMAARRRKARWRLEANNREEREYRVLLAALESVHGLAKGYLQPFLDHRPIQLLLVPQVTLGADKRTVDERHETMGGTPGEDLWLFELLRESPTRFGRCCCGNVYAQRQRGRPRRFCSPSCALKDISSAKNRTRYVREYRRRRRRKELNRAKSALLGVPLRHQIGKLREVFPQKSERALRFLLNRVVPRRKNILSC
jgi:hypothetical protein